MPFQKGHKGFATKTSRKKMSEAKKGSKNHFFGKKFTDEHKEKLSKAKKGKPFPGESFSWEGKKLSKQHRQKLRGKNHWNWKGGITKIEKICRRLPEYIEWRSSIFERDNFTCRVCEKKGCYITAHHVKSFSKILKKNNIKTAEQAIKCGELWESKNGITLCEECHSLTDNYKGRNNKKIK